MLNEKQASGAEKPSAGAVRIVDTLKADTRGELPVAKLAAEVSARLRLLYDLPLQFAAEKDLRVLYELILRRVMELIPGAMRGALLILDPVSGKLALRASVPEVDPPISRTLIQRAIGEGNGFIWRADRDSEVSQSIRIIGVRTGMYVPLLWQNSPVGVLCVDNPERTTVFRKDDLQFMMAVGHYAAAAVANQILQQELAANNQTMEHLLANFSPKLRHKLLRRAQDGNLKSGGEKSQVTILISDLRGFTKLSAAMLTEDVVAMLNDYFAELVEVIFQHDGTVDKFMGDAVLAVFGSPEADPEHSLKAVRAAVAMQKAAIKVIERRRKEGKQYCELGLGVHRGEVLHGFIGAEERLEFTVIGDTVNRASRYCAGAKGGEIVLSPTVYEALGGAFKATEDTIGSKYEGDMKVYVIRDAGSSGD